MSVSDLPDIDFIGDIVGRPGRHILSQKLEAIVAEEGQTSLRGDSDEVSVIVEADHFPVAVAIDEPFIDR